MDMDMGRDSSVSQWHGSREHRIAQALKIAMDK